MHFRIKPEDWIKMRLRTGRGIQICPISAGFGRVRQMERFLD